MKAAPATSRQPSFWTHLRAPFSSFKTSSRSAFAARRTLFAAAAVSTAHLLSSAVAALSSIRHPLSLPLRPAVAVPSPAPATPPHHITRRFSLSTFSPFKFHTCPAPLAPGTSDRTTPGTMRIEAAGSSSSPPKASEEPLPASQEADVPDRAKKAKQSDTSAAGPSSEGESTKPDFPSKGTETSLPYWKTVGDGEVFSATSAFQLSSDCVLFLHKGDITKWAVDQETDAIVNAANERMLGGGGVDGAIHRAAGPDLLTMCKAAPVVSPGVRCPTGSAVVTGSGRLPCKRVIHTVGPVYQSKEHSEPLLTSAYKSSMEQARSSGVRFVAFPAISCGIFGYPLNEGAEVSISTVRQNCEGVNEVHFVLFGQKEVDAWLSVAQATLKEFSLDQQQT